MLFVVNGIFLRFNIRNQIFLEFRKIRICYRSFLKKNNSLLKANQKSCLQLVRETVCLKEGKQHAGFVTENQICLAIEPHGEPVSFDFFIFHGQMIPVTYRIAIPCAQKVCMEILRNFSDYRYQESNSPEFA